MSKKVLISTLPPIDGGVPHMVKLAINTLRNNGLEPIIAYYQPYSLDPELSVPSYKTISRQIAKRETVAFGDVEAHAVGAWLPELEYFHYYPTYIWKDLIAKTNYHIAVSGNCLAAAPYALTGRPFWAWVASSWDDDRSSRVTNFSSSRRIFDRFLNRPCSRQLEKKILRSGRFAALSESTRARLNRFNGPEQVQDIVPVPVDSRRFRPLNIENKTGVPLTVGFVGRLSDPRKNIALFLRTLKALRDKNIDAQGILIGGDLSSKDVALVKELHLSNVLELPGYITDEKLPEYINRFDVFLLPSEQEGLCLGALEAMSCGIPVISTRCGGPEEFVRDGVNGYLVSHDEKELADAIIRVTDPESSKRFARAARQTVIDHYGVNLAEQRLWRSFSAAIGIEHKEQHLAAISAH